MYYILSTALRKRKCSFCGKEIPKSAIHVIRTAWLEDRGYPMKENICFDCIAKVANAEFIAFLRSEADELEKILYLRREHDSSTVT